MRLRLDLDSGTDPDRDAELGVELERRPAGGASLRAWDAADEYALDHLAAQGALDARTLVVNDSFGALGVTLAARAAGATGAEASLDTWSDSYVSELALRDNLARNGLDPDRVRAVASADELGRYDTVVVKIPRHRSLLEHQLRTIARRLAPDAVVVGAAMTKHVHTSTVEAFDRWIGPTTTTLAKRKARLILAMPDPMRETDEHDHAPDDDRDEGWSSFALADGTVVWSGPGVFSGQRLDAGAAALIEALRAAAATLDGVERIVDLGCGNGVVGLAASALWPRATLTFVDESRLAVASARRTWQSAHGARRDARFELGDSLTALADGPPPAPGEADLVLVNPPFHVDNARTDATAWAMFADAHRVLRPGGEVWVVGNRHLAYHAKLTRRFGNCAVAASNATFVVLRATRR